MIIDCPKKKSCKTVEEEECEDVPVKKCKTVKVIWIGFIYFFLIDGINSVLNFIASKIITNSIS